MLNSHLKNVACVPAGESEPANLAEMLCYGCLVPFWDSKPDCRNASQESLLRLPAYAESVILERMQDRRQAKLKEEISDFLL